MSEHGDWTSRLGQAIALAGRGERDLARAVLTDLWAELADGDDAVARCAIAHQLADVQDDPRDELSWDLRALEAADALTPEALARSGAPGSVAGLYPSLHLNLAEDYRKLGDLPSARHHLELGQRARPALADDGYGHMIGRGLDDLAARLASDEARASR